MADKMNTSPIDSSSPCPPAGFGGGGGGAAFDVPSPAEVISDASKVTPSFM